MLFLINLGLSCVKKFGTIHYRAKCEIVWYLFVCFMYCVHGDQTVAQYFVTRDKQRNQDMETD